MLEQQLLLTIRAGKIRLHFALLMSDKFLASIAVLVSAGIELIFFLVAGTVLCFGFSVRIMLITL